MQRVRYSKECPNGCGRLCDRKAKQCRVCLSEDYAKTRKMVQLELARIDNELRRKDQPRLDQVGTVERAGFCAEGDYCARWHCKLCECYWLGRADDHHCVGRVKP